MTHLTKIKFQEDILEVIINGKKWVSVNKICDNLGLHRPTQQTKLKNDPTFESRLIEVPSIGTKNKQPP